MVAKGWIERGSESETTSKTQRGEREHAMKSSLLKRSVLIAGRKTSVSIEEPFWNGVKEIAGLKNLTLSGLVEEINTDREHGNLSSAIRLFVLDYYKRAAFDVGAS
jgi:predicted DNA-binding ribbon-helix-helix protein